MIAEAHNAILAARGIIVCIKYVHWLLLLFLVPSLPLRPFIILPPSLPLSLQELIYPFGSIRLIKADIAYILAHSGAKVVLADHEYAHLLPASSPLPASNEVDDPMVAPLASASPSLSNLDPATAEATEKLRNSRDGEVKQPGFKLVISKDTGRLNVDDAYEEFLARGRRVSDARGGWEGLDVELDEEVGCALNYTCVCSFFLVVIGKLTISTRSGTTGRPKGVLTTLRGTPLSPFSPYPF